MMGDRLIDTLMRLSPRERGLLGLLVAVVLPALVWLVLIAPLLDRHAAALAARDEARSLGVWVVDRAGEAARLVTPGAALPQAPIGVAGLESSLVDAGLRDEVSELGSQSDGGIELRFDAVAFTELADWLSRSDPGWGYDLSAFRLERGTEPGLVSADLTLRPAR